MISITNFIVLIFLFLLSDFYYPGIGRLYDYFAMALLLALLLSRLTYFFKKGYIFREALLLLAICIPWIFYGALFNDSLLASGAMVLGMVFIFPLTYLITDYLPGDQLETNIKILICLSALALFAQTAAYYITGQFFDIPGIFGAIESRGLNEGLNYFRPSGIFQEPNAYCTAMFCLLSTCPYFKNRSYCIELIGIVSMVVTQSLWGFGGVLLLIYLLYGFKWLLLISTNLFLLAQIILFILGISIHDLADLSVTLNRVINIDDDPSTQARYGTSEALSFDAYLLLGHGVDTLRFQSIAANGFAFLIYCFGILGSSVIALYFFFLLRIDFRTMLSIGFLLTTFPLFSYMCFWSLLAIYLVRLRAK